jgi:hypothetical protein
MKKNQTTQDPPSKATSFNTDEFPKPQATVEPPAKRTSETMEYLAVLYTDQEKYHLATQLAQANQAMGDAEDKKKVIDAEHKETVEGLKLSIKRLSRKLTQGAELRNVQCVWLMEDPTRDQKTLVRRDTGETVRIVPMQEHDYQDNLQIKPEAIATPTISAPTELFPDPTATAPANGNTTH